MIVKVVGNKPVQNSCFEFVDIEISRSKEIVPFCVMVSV
jgi:hypothetical protein